jgi:hypothetical protein
LTGDSPLELFSKLLERIPLIAPKTPKVKADARESIIPFIEHLKIFQVF